MEDPRPEGKTERVQAAFEDEYTYQNRQFAIYLVECQAIKCEGIREALIQAGN